MGFLSLLGFGERRKKVLNYLKRDALIIDLRFPEEFEAGHIKGSLHMNQEDIELHFEEIHRYNRPVILCCGSGLRSDEAGVMLREAGIDAINAGNYDRLKEMVEQN